MIQRIGEADIEGAVASWNSWYPSKYAITPRLFSQHLDSGLVESSDGAWVTYKIGRAEQYFGAPGTDWIGAVAAPNGERGAEMLRLGEQQLHDHGTEKVGFGGDIRHIYPGAPEDVPWLQEALSLAGYTQEGAAWDLTARLADLPVNPWPSAAHRAVKDDGSRIRQFLAEEFHGRWFSDTHHRLENETDCSWFVYIEDQARIVAFAHASTEKNRFLQPNLNFSAGIGNAVGGIGPIGVAADKRGTGLGRQMMIASIEALREEGCDAICIDWTGLLDFYGKFGFTPYTKYLMYSKPVQSQP